MTVQGNVFDRISARYFQLTPSEKRVADYILGHRDRVQYMSISELAADCAVADATISRFCRRLGIGGFNAFKLETAKAASAPSGSRAAHEAAYQPILEEHIAALEQTAQLLDREQVHRALKLLLAASRVVCMGQGISMIMAEEAWTMFSSISPKFGFVPDAHLQINTVALMNPGDVVLFFSYSGSTRDLQDVLQVAKMRKVKVILISRFSDSPGGRLADVVLQCGTNERPLQQGSVSARMSQLFVLDVLMQQMYQATKAQAEDTMARISDALGRKHL